MGGWTGASSRPHLRLPRRGPRLPRRRSPRHRPPGLPAGFYPDAVAFWDADQGLIAGRAGCPEQCGAAVIAATADGGQRWQVVHTGGTRILGLAAAGQTHAWAAVSTCANAGPDCQTTLMRSGDGGRTWVEVSDGVIWPSFADARTGWALPHQAAKGWGLHDAPSILTTADGGQSWQPIRSPCPERRFGTRSVSLASPTQGWAACGGQPGAGQQLKALYATADGGRTWTAAGDLGGGGYLAGIFFRPGGHGWLWRSRGVMSATADGGQTWRWVAATQAEVREVRSAWLVSDQVGYLLIRDNAERAFKLEHTGDGGDLFTVRAQWPIDP